MKQNMSQNLRLQRPVYLQDRIKTENLNSAMSYQISFMKSYNQSISFILYGFRSLEGTYCKFLEVLLHLSVAMSGMTARNLHSKNLYHTRDVTNVVYAKS
jgi:hypothetical protein